MDSTSCSFVVTSQPYLTLVWLGVAPLRTNKIVSLPLTSCYVIGWCIASVITSSVITSVITSRAIISVIIRCIQCYYRVVVVASVMQMMVTITICIAIIDIIHVHVYYYFEHVV